MTLFHLHSRPLLRITIGLKPRRGPAPSINDPPQGGPWPHAFSSQVFQLLENSRVRFGRPGLGLPLQILMQESGMTKRAYEAALSPKPPSA